MLRFFHPVHSLERNAVTATEDGQGLRCMVPTCDGQRNEPPPRYHSSIHRHCGRDGANDAATKPIPQFPSVFSVPFELLRSFLMLLLLLLLPLLLVVTSCCASSLGSEM